MVETKEIEVEIVEIECEDTDIDIGCPNIEMKGEDEDNDDDDHDDHDGTEGVESTDNLDLSEKEEKSESGGGGGMWCGVNSSGRPVSVQLRILPKKPPLPSSPSLQFHTLPFNS